MVKGRVGMGSLGDLPTDKILEYAVLAERNEFDSIWIAGHILYRDPFGLLSAVATRTSKIKLGVGVTSAYARPIATLAMNVATLDEISKGRVLLGIGTQIRFWNQLGVMDKRPLATLRKTINILRRILAGRAAREYAQKWKLYCRPSLFSKYPVYSSGGEMLFPRSNSLRDSKSLSRRSGVA